MITIVMTYFNRKEQLEATLKSIGLTKYTDFEVMIIDDASAEDHKIDDLINKFGFKINLIRVEPEEKTWLEPLVLINKTIRECKSNVIILQNAEALHVGDVISSTANNIRDKVYLSFACLYMDEEWSKKIRAMDTKDIIASLPSSIDPSIVLPHAFGILGRLPISWANHSKYKDFAYPFCAAFMREDYLAIGGLDERFADGYAAVDDDLVDKFKIYCKIVYIDDPLVIHQWHPNFFGMHSNRQELYDRNVKIWRENQAKRAKK